MFLPQYAFHNRQAGGGGPVFDPATLSPTIWVRAAYSGSPWADISGNGRDLTEGTNPPGNGVSLNGRTVAVADGVNDVLANATALSTLAPKTGFFFWLLFYANSIATTTGVGAAYGNDQLWADSGGYVGAALATATGVDSVQFWLFDGVGKGNQHPITLGTWNLLCGRFDSTQTGEEIRSKLNSGAIEKAASGDYDNDAGTLKLFRNYDGSQFADARIADFGMVAGSCSDADFDNVRLYANDYHGTSL